MSGFASLSVEKLFLYNLGSHDDVCSIAEQPQNDFEKGSTIFCTSRRTNGDNVANTKLVEIDRRCTARV